MSGLIFIIPADGRPLRLYHATMHPSLCRLHKMVRGFIERVPHWNHFGGQPCVAYCNEEGKIEGLPVNVVGTMLWQRTIDYMVNDVLCGTIVVIIGLAEETRPEWRDNEN